MPRVSLRAYARHRGCALNAVQKAIKAGRIAKGEDGLIDIEAADAAWSTNTDAAKRRQEAAEVPPALAEPPLLSGEVLPPPAATPPSSPLSDLSRFYGSDWPEQSAIPLTPGSVPPADGEKGRLIDAAGFMAAKTRLAWAEVELREAALAEKRGLSINGELARKTFREIGKIYASARRGLKDEIAPKVVGLTDVNEIARRVEQVIHETDERIANEILAKYSDVLVGDVQRSGTGS